uniref:VWFA domain-containing protein n=1 Tax=Ciona savignyi TaxID=51511 RepID=H2YCG9_CIOSA
MCLENGAFDIVFAVDTRTTSESVLQHIRDFIHTISVQFPISTNATRIGIVQFSKEAKSVLHLNQGTSLTNLVPALRSIDSMGAGQNLNEVLSLVRYVEFHPLLGRRTEYPGLVVLLTGSRSSTTKEELEFWRRSLRSAHANVVTIGLGSSMRDKHVTLSGDAVLRVDNFSDLDFSLAQRVVEYICKLSTL